MTVAGVLLVMTPGALVGVAVAVGVAVLVVFMVLLSTATRGGTPHAPVAQNLNCPNCGTLMEVGYLRTRGLAWSPSPGIWSMRGISILSRKYSTPAWRCVRCGVLTANYGA